MLFSICAAFAQNKADTTQLGVYSTGARFAITRADLGAQLPTTLIGEMVVAFDTVKVIARVADSSRSKQKHSYTRQCNYIAYLKANSAAYKDKIVLMDLNKACDVSQILMLAQRSGAKAFVFVYHSNGNGNNLKLPKLGVYKDSIRMPIFTVGREKGADISTLLPSVVGIRTKGSTVQNLLNRLTLNLNAQAESSKARLTWVNNTGFLNDYFILQKLNPTTGVFEDMRTLNTRPSEDIEYYTDFDNAPSVGDNIYRVKLVLADGTSRFSEEKIVKFYANEAVTLFPNPANDILNLAFKGYTGQAIDFSISDMQGRSIMVQRIEKLQTDIYTLYLADHISAGQYTLRIQSAGKREVVKVFTVGK
ncbi:MAG: T9SS type A sorting domain-containing protein [Saprospiraceae bacterium]|nr:T9SS type A sorting domain-containing protein [Saprospiraceae bacterium]